MAIFNTSRSTLKIVKAEQAQGNEKNVTFLSTSDNIGSTNEVNEVL
jgi:hypothetical protein